MVGARQIHKNKIISSDQISFTQLHKKSWFMIMGGYTTQYIGDSPNSMYI